MKASLAFVKKEILSHLRSGKLYILLGVFALVGAMNPVTAKLTPWLLEMLGESLEASGMNIVVTTPTALDSWMQFYKNIPMALIAFVIIESDIFTKEYRSGTLILALTKGLNRRTVLIAKALMLVVSWTVCYWFCFGVSYGITACIWDNSVAQSLAFSALCWWMFGLWTVMLAVLFSAVSKSYIIVLVGTGGVAFVTYLVGMLPKINEYLPSMLLEGTSLVYGLSEPKAYTASLVITAVLCVLLFVVSVPVFNKKEM